MRIYKLAYTKPLPLDAKIKTGTETIRKRKFEYEYVTITDRQGEPKKCRIKETAQGKRIVIESSLYTIVFRDHTGTQRRLQADREKGPSEDLAEKIRSLVYHRERNSGETLPADLQQWADELPEAIYSQLAGFGLLKQRRAIVSQDLESLLSAFEQYLALKKQRAPKYIQETVSKLRRTFKACGFRTFADIDDAVLDKYLIRLRDKRNAATRTLNGYVRSCQQFCRWAVKRQKVAKHSPLECMESFGSEAADRRRVRRALTADEIQRLLTTTAQSSEVHYGMDGPERAMLYRFALMTGLRLNEIRTLRVEHLDFDHPEGPVLYVDAAYSKHRERDTLPLHKDLVPILKRFILERGKTPQAKLFGGDYEAVTDKAARMIREDEAEAAIEYKTIAGQADFHSLRHTYVSSLKTIAARLAQGLARHKSSDMTDRYSHRSLAEQRAALEQVKVFGLAG